MPSAAIFDDSHGAEIVQISVNPRGGVPKFAVREAVVGREGMDGDKQRNSKIHGGPLRAVCLYSWERIRALQEEGHPIDCGTAGENLTLRGLDWAGVVPGIRLRLGHDVVLEIVSYTSPCTHIAGSFVDGAISRISQKTHPGWSRVYASVLREGKVETGAPVEALGPEGSAS